MIEPAFDKVNTTNFILEELKKGNERAFDFVFRQYYKVLSQFSYSFVKEQIAAESIVQDVFIKLWERREVLGDISNLQSYLLGMVKNQSIDFLRQEKSNSRKYLNLKVAESANTTEEQVSINEFEEKLLKSIMKLPDRCREAIEMSRFEGLPNKEIARQMQISVKGVEALIGRSLKLLRVELSEFLPSDTLAKHKNRPTVLFSLLLTRLKGIMIHA